MAVQTEVMVILPVIAGVVTGELGEVCWHLLMLLMDLMAPTADS